MSVLLFVLLYTLSAAVVHWWLPPSLDPLYRAVALLAPALVLGVLLAPGAVRRR